MYEITFADGPFGGVEETSRLYFSRPVIKSSKSTDTFKFYIGPKTQKTLAAYDDADKNSFKIQNTEITPIIVSRPLLGWLESILKFFLELFYKLIPNYGIAIILLTVLIKIIFYPLTKKSFESTSKMQGISPLVEEVRTKYKDNPTKMNQEMSALYKREGVNPMGGCLPMALQIPVFFALYGLLNNHFDLRGASFLFPWITDLSAPESIWNFAPFKLPFVGWSDLRLLPIIFVGSQIISTKFTQAQGAQSNSQMKMFTLAMPIVFFFILYDMPSGLLLYWIVTNVLSTGQQIFINKRKKTHSE